MTTDKLHHSSSYITLPLTALNSSFLSGHLTNQHFGQHKQKALVAGLGTQTQQRVCLFSQGSDTVFCLAWLVETGLAFQRHLKYIQILYLNIPEQLRSLPFLP